MANMFSGNGEKEIPKTFEDCYKTDTITKNLLGWAERIEEWGSILLILIIIFGIINTIFTGITTYQEVDVLEISDDATISAILTVLTSLFTYALYAFIEYCIFKAISLLINALASIVKNTRITANVALYKFATENDILTNNIESTNKVTTSVVSSDNERNNSNKNSRVWHCEKCGNLVSSNPCVHCGYKKS